MKPTTVIDLCMPLNDVVFREYIFIKFILHALSLTGIKKLYRNKIIIFSTDMKVLLPEAYWQPLIITTTSIASQQIIPKEKLCFLGDGAKEQNVGYW